MGAVVSLGFFFVVIVVVAVIGFTIFGFVRDNNSPRLTVNARVLSKRISTTMHNNGPNMASTTSTSYHVVFQVESGDKLEFLVRHDQYYSLEENEYGRLFFQGKRFLSFERMQ